MTTQEQLRALAEAAREATPGDHWHVVRYGDGDSLVIHSSGDWRVCFMATPGDSPGAMGRIKALAAFIAAANPQTIIALLDRQVALEAEKHELAMQALAADMQAEQAYEKQHALEAKLAEARARKGGK